MKTSLIVILFFLCLQVLSQIDKQDKINQRDFLRERMNQGSNLLEQIKPSLDPVNFQRNESKSIVKKTVLDNGFLMTEFLRQNWDGSNWVNIERYSYTYDENNNRIEYLRQDWDGSIWVYEWKNTYIFDENNNEIKNLRQEWDGADWVNDYEETNIYNENNNKIERLSQDWDGSNWVNRWKYTNIYDENNNMIEYSLQD